MLRDAQQALLAAIDGSGAPPRLIEGALTSAERVSVYRHTIESTLAAALTAVYPVVKAIVGDAFFFTAAREYAVAHPSTSGDVSTFGKDFSAFLGRYPHARELDYLPDVARLEWARHCALTAADCAALDVAALAAIPTERQDEIRFCLNPSLTLIASAFPLDDIWRVNQPGYAGEMALDWDSTAKTFVVYRPKWDVAVVRLNAGHAAFIRALGADATLAEATETAFARDGRFDLATCLAASVLARMLAGFSV